MSGFQSHRTLEPVRWLGLPLLACVAGTIVLAVPLRLFGLGLPEPVFGFIPAFAWAVIRPSFVAPFLLLLLGFFLDLYWGATLGLWAFALILAYAFVISTRSLMAGQSRMIMWIWYVAACMIGFGAAYVITLLETLRQPNLVAVVFQFAATAALYPLAHVLIQQFEDADVRFR